MSRVGDKADEKLVTVIVPVWNSGKFIPQCLKSLQGQKFQDFSIIMVDDGSTDGSLAHVRSDAPECLEIISFSQNRGFAAAVNAGIQKARSKYIALLNVDVIVDPSWLHELVAVLDNTPEDVGALASKMVQMAHPELIDDAGDILSWYGSALKRGHGRSVEEFTRQEAIQFVCAGAALYRKDFFERVGGFDEQFSSYLEDVDISLRGLLYGYKYIYVPTAQVRHLSHSAGILGARYVYLMTRNRLMLFMKNIPLSLLFRHAHQIFYGQIYFFLIYKKPLSSLRAIGSFVMQLHSLRRKRRMILANMKIFSGDLNEALSNDLGEPRFWQILRRKLLL